MTLWDPPSELGYRWHLGSDPATATDVAIRFRPEGSATTRVEIEHRGWERLGEAATEWRARNHAGWDSLLAAFRRGSRERRTLMPAGTKEDPWELTTPPGTSAYTMYRDDDG